MPPRVPLPAGPFTFTGTLLSPPGDGSPSARSPLKPQQSAPPVVSTAQLVRPGMPSTRLTPPSVPCPPTPLTATGNGLSWNSPVVPLPSSPQVSSPQQATLPVFSRAQGFVPL